MNGLVESVGRGLDGAVPSLPYGASTVAGAACYCSGAGLVAGTGYYAGAAVYS